MGKLKRVLVISSIILVSVFVFILIVCLVDKDDAKNKNQINKNMSLVNESGSIFWIQPYKGRLSNLYKNRQYSTIIKKSEYLEKLSNIEKYIIGMSYYKRKKYSGAIKYFEDYLKAKPAISDYINFYLGQCYYYKKDYKKAIDYYKFIRNNFPDSTNLENAIDLEMRCYVINHDFSKMNEEIFDIEKQKIVDLDDDDIKARIEYYKALSFRYKREYGKSLKHFINVLKYKNREFSAYSLENISSNFKEEVANLEVYDRIYIAYSLLNKRERKKKQREKNYKIVKQILDSIDNADILKNDNNFIFYNTIYSILLFKKKDYKNAYDNETSNKSF